GIVGQAQAFGGTPLMVLGSGHGNPPAALQRGRLRFGSSASSCASACGQAVTRSPILLFKIAGNAYRYRWTAAWGGRHAVGGASLLCCAARGSRDPHDRDCGAGDEHAVSPPASERIANDTGGRIGTYLSKYEALRKSGQRVMIDGTCASAC